MAYTLARQLELVVGLYVRPEHTERRAARGRTFRGFKCMAGAACSLVIEEDIGFQGTP